MLEQNKFGNYIHVSPVNSCNEFVMFSALDCSILNSTDKKLTNERKRNHEQANSRSQVLQRSQGF